MTAVLVTGASGFVGRALCSSLVSRGDLVRAATRAQDLSGIASFAVGDIGPDTEWGAAVTGCECVVHLAAHVHVMGGRKDFSSGDFHRINVEGSANLARQAAHAGARRFIFLSSVKVNGEDSAQRAFVESDPVMPADAYGASKAQAEQKLQAIAGETGMEIVIVRPPLVYGPGVRANFLSLLRVVDSGMPLPLSSVSNLRSLVYVGNLVDALGACLTHPAAANRIFFVSDDQDVATPQLIRALAAALGRKPLLFPFPPALLRAAAVLAGRAEQIDRLTGSLQVNIGSIKAALGWRAPFSLQHGLAQTVSWYRSTRR